jgi:hypothetical protein
VGVADKQPTTSLLLEPADVLTDRGLPEAEAASGLAEAACLSNGEETLQEDWIKHGYHRS